MSEKITVHSISEKLGIPRERMTHQCHSISIAMLNAGMVPGGRVARGSARGVAGQHSWIVVGHPYDASAQIIDSTFWSYRHDVSDVWFGTLVSGLHHPHGWASIFDSPPPIFRSDGGEEIRLDGLSNRAEGFLKLLRERTGTLDIRTWMSLFNGPMLGWPSAEIIDRAWQNDTLRPLIPIDIVGMLTDHNPGGLYLPTEKDETDE